MSPARLAVSALFLANGLISGCWSVFVPAIKGNLAIGESVMGLLISDRRFSRFCRIAIVGTDHRPCRFEGSRDHCRRRAGARPFAAVAGNRICGGGRAVRTILPVAVSHGCRHECQRLRCRTYWRQGDHVVLSWLLEPRRHAWRSDGGLCTCRLWPSRPGAWCNGNLRCIDDRCFSRSGRAPLGGAR